MSFFIVIYNNPSDLSDSCPSWLAKVILDLNRVVFGYYLSVTINRLSYSLILNSRSKKKHLD